MTAQKLFHTLALCCFLLRVVQASGAQTISIAGAPGDTGYNVGTVATIRATVTGLEGEPGRYAAFAEFQYVGTTATTSVQMDRLPESKPGEARYEAGWPIPADAPTGLYRVTVKVEDRTSRKVIAAQKLRSFAAYKKLVRIVRTMLDKTFYTVGESIQCEVVLENLTDSELKDLRVEFSNANYPWISLFSAEGQNPELALRVMRESMTLPARGQATIPMMPAGTAAFLQGQQVAVLGAGGPARNEKVPTPEVDQYTIAVWNADRTVLYDMQFSPRAIVRAPDRDLPKPYSGSFAHPYLSDIDFKKYREFYPREKFSPAITVNPSHTLYRPGDTLTVEATLKNPFAEGWRNLEVHAQLSDSSGKVLHDSELASGVDLIPGENPKLKATVWGLPASLAPGVYYLKLTLRGRDASRIAETTTEIAVNPLPASLMVFCPHEDDEHAYAGLIHAAVEAGLPVRVVVFTGGDVGACERYYSKPCGPNEAREFGMVRMEETALALEHIGLRRDKLTFLGLPDGGSGAIWSTNIKVSNPFLSIYLATDHAPYENVLKPNLPYARDAVIETVKQLILDFKPAMIATPHPDERHVDHRTTNWFVLKACQELLREKKIDPATVVLADRAYGAGGFKPAPYKYVKALVYLSGEAATLKEEMSWIYQSQDGNIDEGMRKSYVDLPREELHFRILDWQEHEGWNE